MGAYEFGRNLTAAMTRHVPQRVRSAFLANRAIFGEMLEYSGAEGLRDEALRLGVRGKWVEASSEPGDIARAEHLARTYLAMKATQALVDPAFRPHPIWADLLETDWRKGRSAAESGDYRAFDGFLRNFFRNGGVSGVWGSGDMFRSFLEMSEWDELARLALFVRQLKAWRREAPDARIDDVAHQRIGNPWGYNVSGHLVIEPEFEYHELALRMRKLLQPTQDPLVVEIGGGFGGFAAQLLTQIPGARYVGFDLPENVVIQAYHASRSFPGKRVLVDDTSALGAPDTISILPNWRLSDAQVHNADLLVNVRSFAEMSAETLSAYFIQIRRMAPTWIYHENVAGGRRDQTHGIPVSDYPALPEYKQVASNESRWPRYDRDSAYPCREHLLQRAQRA